MFEKQFPIHPSTGNAFEDIIITEDRSLAVVEA
jgi:hypothetical protein